MFSGIAPSTLREAIVSGEFPRRAARPTSTRLHWVLNGSTVKTSHIQSEFEPWIVQDNGTEAAPRYCKTAVPFRYTHIATLPADVSR